jgi:hypothetical protein
MGVESGTRGSLYFNDFESRRVSYIGLLPVPPAKPETGPRDYAYTDPAHRHAVTNVSIDGVSIASYTYDANGNQTCRVDAFLA